MNAKQDIQTLFNQIAEAANDIKDLALRAKIIKAAIAGGQKAQRLG